MCRSTPFLHIWLIVVCALPFPWNNWPFHWYLRLIGKTRWGIHVFCLNWCNSTTCTHFFASLMLQTKWWWSDECEFNHFWHKNMQLMIKHTHIMAIPMAHPLPKFNRRYAEAEGKMWQLPWPSTKRRQCSKSSP
jgi:hypothetical protein